jgi:L-serine/L-threonine ammonia-lyase
MQCPRGIGNLILSHVSHSSYEAGHQDEEAPNAERKNQRIHFFSSSGGNAGLAAVVAARDLNCPCTVVVPLSTKPMMVQKLREAGAAEVIQHGASWYEADAYLRERFIDVPGTHRNSKMEAMANGVAVARVEDHAEILLGRSSDAPAVVVVDGDEDGAEVKNVYVPPFDHAMIWEGNSTLVDELARQLPAVVNNGHQLSHEPAENDGIVCHPPFPADIIICSVGGGGLFNGVIEGLDRHINGSERPPLAVDHNRKPVHVIAVETQGAESLAYSLAQNSVQPLPSITSRATSLGALEVASQTFRNAKDPPAGVRVSSVVASDGEAARGVVRLAEANRLLVELACGVAVDVAVSSLLKEVVPDLSHESRVVVVVCGGSGVTLEMLAEYRLQLAG